MLCSFTVAQFPRSANEEGERMLKKKEEEKMKEKEILIKRRQCKDEVEQMLCSFAVAQIPSS